ncbi:MAG: GNAT family N-acetyltransferase [Gammaproteobacteria bacterium]|jgi:RimJ/RimL family protein N-acetyltransferase
MSRWIEPTVLSGRHVTLEPLARSHADELAAATRDGDLWKLWYTHIPAPEAVGDYIDAALELREHAGAMPFAVRHNNSGVVVGSTRYLNVDESHHRLEIGNTWYARRVQRTALNSECKLLLLQHAFEALDAIAVEFRTHWHNRASRAAIVRLGAKQDGVLRQHQRAPDGSYRDTVVFSILNSEWPAVRRALHVAVAAGDTM